MKKILSLTRSARRQLVVEEGYDISTARDIFFARLTAYLLARHEIISADTASSLDRCAEAIHRELHDIPQFVARAASRERAPTSLDGSLVEAVAADPLVMGWAYQFWNDTERDTVTKGVSRRGEPQTEHDEIAVATQLFTEEYMASFLIDRAPSLRDSSTTLLSDLAGEVLDPACGVGHILVPFLRALRAQRGGRDLSAEGSLKDLSRIHGCDIDETAVEICRVLLLVESQMSPGVASDVAWSIVRANITRLHSPWGTLDRQASPTVLTRSYQYVLTNPPYIGRRKLNEETREFLDAHYPATSMDLCAAFMERCLELTADGGTIGLVTVDKWLRLKPYEALRVGGKGFAGLYRALSLDVVCELGNRAFNTSSGLHDGVGVCLLVGTKAPPTGEHTFSFVSVADKRSMGEKARGLDAWRVEGGAKIRQRELLLDGESSTFILRHGVPSTLASSGRTVRDVARVLVGLQTSDDRRFVRHVWSVPPDRSRWIVHCKGGGYDRWFGLNRFVLDWGEGQRRFERDPKSGIAVREWFDRDGWTYTWFANGSLGLRRKEAGWSFGRAASSAVFCDDTRCVAFLNSRIASLLARRLGGKAQLPEGVVRSLPIPESFDGIDPRFVSAAVLLKRALVEHDPTDSSFSPWRAWDPRAQVSIQALLLVVEGVLERQVCECLRLSHAERRELDDTMGMPVAWHSRGETPRDDEVWRHVPEAFHYLRSLVEPFTRGEARGCTVVGQSVRHMECSIPSTESGRPLPATSLVESIGRRAGIHPFDVAIDVMDGIGSSAVVNATVVAPALYARIVTLALTALGHQWWGEEARGFALECPEMPVGDIASRVGELLPVVMRIPEHLSSELLGGSLEGWMMSTMRSAQLRIFSQTPLFELKGGPSRSGGYLRHVWSTATSTMACDTHESLERRFQ
jgi:hypothetical protein